MKEAFAAALAPAFVAWGIPVSRIELLAFVREQSISISAYRNGADDDWSSTVI